MIVLDASVLIAQFSDDDAHHVAARDLLAKNASEDFMISSVTLAEVLVEPTKLGRQAETLALVAEIGVEVADVRGHDAGLLADLRHSTRLRLPDCCVLHAAKQVGGSIATFDERLAAAAETLGVNRVT